MWRERETWMGANLWPRTKTWNTWKQKLHLKAAASSARPCGDKRRSRRWPGPGVGSFAIPADLLAGGQDVWSRLIPAHRCGAAPLGAFLWHGPTAGSTGPSNALLLLCVFVGSSWSPNVENEFWESYLRFLEAAALPACLWWLLEYPGQGGFASPALGKIWQELIMASVGRWFLTWSSAELVTPSPQSSEGWQGKGISQHLNSCSLFLISLRDNSNGWIETGPNSQDRK